MNKVKGIGLCLMLVCGSMAINAQIEEWQWTETAGGQRHDYSRTIAPDNQGNCYVAGEYDGIAWFGAYQLGSWDVDCNYIAKINPQGNWLWVNSDYVAGYPSSIYGHYRLEKMVIDGAYYLYLVGCFSGTINSNNHVLTSIGSEDIIVLKLDSNGDCIWAAQAGGIGGDMARDIALDESGNVYVTGLFYDVASFGQVSLDAGVDSDGFVAKLDNDGNWLWAQQMSGYLSSYGLDLDGSSNVYVTGDFTGNADFGDISLSSATSIYPDVFLAKLTNGGSWLWAVRAGGSYNDYSSDIVVDYQGNSYITGDFQESLSLGSHQLYNSGDAYDRDLFIAKADTNGNWVWGISGGGVTFDRGNSIDFDGRGNLFVTGAVGSAAVFGDHAILTSPGGGPDILVAKADTDGNWLWAMSTDAIGQDEGYDIKVDVDENVYITGSYKDAGNWEEIWVGKIGYNSPVVDFSADVLEGFAELQVEFTDNSIPGNSQIVSWLWDFGDGTTSGEQNPMHTYVTPGVYDVSLMAVNANALSSSAIAESYITVLARIPEIEMTTASTLNFGNVYVEESSEYQAITLSSVGGALVNIEDIHFLYNPSSFELQQPLPGSAIEHGDSITIWVRFSPQTVGTIADTLYIANSSVNSPMLKVKLTGVGLYVLPQTPQGVQININGNDVNLSWEAVTQNLHNQPVTPDYYIVFLCDDPYGEFVFHGATPNLQYTVPLTALLQTHMFYRVVAYKYYGRGVFDPQSFGLVPGTPMEEVLKLLP